MRQAGVLAKFGEVSLNTMLLQIEKDHKNAQILAEGLNNIKSVNIELQKVHSNIVYFRLNENETSLSSQLVKIMEEKGIVSKANHVGKREVL